MLRSASALEAYRRFYVREILPWKVAEFLIFSDSFPRSIHFCAAQIDEFLQADTRGVGGAPAHGGGARRRAGCWRTCSP